MPLNPFGRKKSRDQRDQTAYTPPPAPLPPREARGDVGSVMWQDELNRRQMPPKAAPLAHFHNRAIVIGIGDAGGDVLEVLGDQLDTASMVQPQSELCLIHIRMPQVSNRSRQIQREDLKEAGILHDLTLQDESRIASDDLNQPHWEWARIKHIPPMDYAIRRHSARVVLFNHLRLGRDASTLMRLLEQVIGRGYTRIFIVASAIEHVGASLIGDLAALARLSAANPSGLSINALVLTEDANSDLAGNDMQQRGYLSATIYELSRLSARSRTRLQYNSGFNSGLIYNPQTEQQLLVNAFNLVWGRHGRGKQRAAYFLWGILTNQALYNTTWGWLTAVDPGAQREQQAVSVLYTHAVLWPVRIFRGLMRERLLQYFIEPPTAPRLPERIRLDCDYRAVGGVLDDWRPFGLLYPLLALQNNLPMKSKAEQNYYRAVIESLREELNASDYRIEQLRQALQDFENNSYARNIGEPPHTWLNPDPDLLKTRMEASFKYLADRAGWFVQDGNETFCVRLMLATAPARVGERFKTSFQVDRRQIDSFYIGQLRDLVEDVVDNQIMSVYVPEFLERLGSDMYDTSREMRSAWQGRFDRWVSQEFQQIFGGQMRLVPRAFMLNVPDNWANTLMPGEVVHGTDPTFGLQGIIMPHVPIENLRAVRNEQVLTDTLVFPEELVTHDLFQGERPLYEIPLELQDALAHREPVWAFYQCWKAGTLSGLFAPRTVWNRQLWQFIERYESRHPEILKTVEAARAALSAETPPESPALPAGDEFGELLAHVFQRFERDLRRLNSYPPPETPA